MGLLRSPTQGKPARHRMWIPEVSFFKSTIYFVFDKGWLACEGIGWVCLKD
ncbi:hypothetical protein VRB78_17825 [Pseudomonas trivialis]|uniref:hypothetical protein n=1 Tax=Pseudomonas trivialis TaxID=200450 RepID=UPI0030D375B0